MPPVAPPVHHRSRTVLLVIFGALAVVMAIVTFTTRTRPFPPGLPVSGATHVEFVAAHAAAMYELEGNTYTSSGEAVDTLGPVPVPAGGELGYLTAKLEMPAPPVVASGSPPAVVVTLPQPVWTLYMGTSTRLGAGRPLGAMDDGSALALTDEGLVAFVLPSSRVSIIKGAGLIVGALSPDKSTVAVGSPATRTSDIYRIASGSFVPTFLGSIPLDPTALAFTDATTLLVLMKDGTVSSYTVSATGAPSLIATTTLANPWP